MVMLGLLVRRHTGGVAFVTPSTDPNERM